MSPLGLTFAVFGFVALVGIICFGKGREVGLAERLPSPITPEMEPNWDLVGAFNEFKETLLKNVCDCKIKHVLNQHVLLYLKVLKIIKHPDFNSMKQEIIQECEEAEGNGSASD